MHIIKPLHKNKYIIYKKCDIKLHKKYILKDKVMIRVYFLILKDPKASLGRSGSTLFGQGKLKIPLSLPSQASSFSFLL